MVVDFFKIRFSKEYFLLLLPLFFLTHGYNENYPSVTIWDVVFLLVQYLFAAYLLCLLLSRVFKSFRLAALYIFALLFVYFFFGAFHDNLKLLLGNGLLTSYAFLLPCLFILLVLLFVFLKKTSNSFGKLVTYVNVALVILILIDGFQLFSKKISEKPVATENLQASFSQNLEKPDIYLILADEYAGKRELKDILNFDNSGFENELAMRGFQIIEEPKSNYNLTVYSMASMLNMKYLPNIQPKETRENNNLCLDLINRNTVTRTLTGAGYRIYNFSIFNLDDNPSLVHQNFIARGTRLITSQTFFNKIYKDLGYHLITTLKISSAIKKDSAANYVNLENNSLLIKKLKEQVSRHAAEPRFIYAHLLMPHYPYYFDANGKPNPLNSLKEGSQYDAKNYLEYLRYCNREFLSLIDDILAHSVNPPVIIFMSDHGWRAAETAMDPSYLFMNFNSIYLPKKYGALPRTFSNVNEFRILFNTLFNQRLPLLKDSTILLSDK
jgi:hypothetical protein